MCDFKSGDIVRFKEPNPDEHGDAMVIVEWNGDRGFGKHLNTGLDVPPVTLIRQDEIVRIEESDG